MHTLKVNTKVIRRLKARGHTVAGLAHLGLPAIETVSDDDGRTHIVQSHAACTAILSDDAFEPSDIGAAVAAVGRTFGVDVWPVVAFLRQTPLLARAADHKAKRNQFMQHHNRMRRKHLAFIRTAAEQHFADLENAASGGLSSRFVTPFVDCVLRRIFDSEVTNGGVLYDQIAEFPASVLDYIHHPRLLGETSRRVERFLAAVAPAEATEPEAGPVALPYLLLAYVLMGRDPLIGGLSAFVHDFALTPRAQAERESLLAETSAGDLFQSTAPVNFIGRTVAQAREIEGAAMLPGDRLLLIIPYANAQRGGTGGATGLAFGHGPHRCAGTALSLEVAEAFIAAFRTHQPGLDFSRFTAEPVVPGVFHKYKRMS